MRLSLLCFSILFITACGGSSSSNNAEKKPSTNGSDTSSTNSSQRVNSQRENLKLHEFSVQNIEKINFKSVESNAISSIKNFK